MLRRITFVLCLFLGIAIVFSGCAKKEKKNYKGTVKLVYVEWSSEVASTNLVKAVIQEKLGYKAEITPVAASAMWSAIATGDSDAMVAAWLPTTHKHYLAKLKNKVDVINKNLIGTRVGLVVPKYVTIDSIAEMAGAADKFDKKIIGIDPGAGIMSMTEKAIKLYNLKDFELVSGSGATMTGALAAAYKNKEWVVVTGWTPHWKFARFDLKYLKDPKNIYGKEEWIGTVVRKGLKKENEEVYNFLKKFRWDPSDMEQLMVWNQEKGSDPYENALRWIKENKDKVDSWLK